MSNSCSQYSRQSALMKDVLVSLMLLLHCFILDLCAGM